MSYKLMNANYRLLQQVWTTSLRCLSAQSTKDTQPNMLRSIVTRRLLNSFNPAGGQGQLRYHSSKFLQRPTSFKSPTSSCLYLQHHYHGQDSDSQLHLTNTGNEDETVVNVTVSANRRSLELREVKGRSARFHTNWLRHCCHCGDCKVSHAGTITVMPHHRLPYYTVDKVHIEGRDLHLHLNEEPGHVTTVSLDFLWEHDYGEEVRERAIEIRKPAKLQDGLPRLTYEELVDSPAGKLRWLETLNKYGVCLLKNVPTEDSMVKKVAEFIWPVQKTIYGKVFDVMNMPNPINVAYSTSGIAMHMDLIYYESAPGLQLLHVLRFDDCVKGGNSTMVDSWQVAERLRVDHPHHFANLSRIPATFQKIHYDREHPVHMVYRKPHIELNPRGEIIALSWAPPFEGPLFVPEEDVEPYFESYHVFAKMLEEQSPKDVEVRLEVGDLLSFNNRRMVHGREKYELNGGTRHLQGCYIQLDEFRSEVEVMSRTIGTGEPARIVGNHSYH